METFHITVSGETFLVREVLGSQGSIGVERVSVAEHTPGQWSACHNGECACKYVLSDDHPVAKVTAGNWGDEPNFPYGRVPEEEAQANARLIAAAPELLDACKAVDQASSEFAVRFRGFPLDDDDLIGVGGSVTIDVEVWKVVHRAINKAKGTPKPKTCAEDT